MQTKHRYTTMRLFSSNRVHNEGDCSSRSLVIVDWTPSGMPYAEGLDYLNRMDARTEMTFWMQLNCTSVAEIEMCL